ncbi:MAG: glutamine-hydrolyzing GMP synthase, partial [Acetobacter sp.]|nr:glutamine-hydrolyzing GMP synthase [Acetobacter sp.]
MPKLSSLSAPQQTSLHHERILILDFGSQLTQLIARRVRESGVYCEIWPFNTSEERILAFAPRGIILSGGPASVNSPNAPRIPNIVFACGVPLLGICYGQQAMCQQLGGHVKTSTHREYGRAILTITEDCALFEGIWSPHDKEQVWMSHEDKVTMLPTGFRAVAVSQNAPFAAIADDTRKFYGLQFHPEVVHTTHGALLLRQFTHNIAGCTGTWTMAGFREMAIHKIREQVGNEHVICGLSGGVDSSVTAVLIHQAIGKQLTCIFVDHGM